MSDTDLTKRLVVGWDNFKTKLSEYVEQVDECTVELHFESSLDERTHYKFEPDELVFISDVQITPKNHVAFGVPFGDKTKWFVMQEAELINAKGADGNQEPFNQVVNRLFREAMVDVPECPSITHLERKHLLADASLLEKLNNSDQFLGKFKLNEERAKLYTKIDNFGMF